MKHGVNYWISAVANAVLNNASTTITFNEPALARRHWGARWWLLNVSGRTPALGPWELSAIRSRNYNLGQSLYVGPALLHPVRAPISDPPWTGELAVDVTNRTGTTTALYLSLLVAPEDP